MYIKRALEHLISQAIKEFPALIITGPRQCGKTTLLKQLFPKYRYISLELPDVRASALADPYGFFSLHPPPIILDEIQYAPELFPYIKENIDASRDKPGNYIMTGSQNLLLLKQVTESLSGRAAILKLLPLSNREINEYPNKPLPWEKEGGRDKLQQTKKIDQIALWQNFLRGGYPELVAHPERNVLLWQSSYIQTYLERDVRSLHQIGDLTSFQSFVRALAARSAQLLNLTELARDVGVAVNTIKSWLSILEATFQIIILRPYFTNVGKRLIKSPKVYFTDTGLLCNLVGLKDTEHALAGPMAGAIFETAVILEIEKSLLTQGLTPNLYFWRTSYGAEVDIIVDNGTNLIPIEIKLSATPNPKMASELIKFKELFGKKVTSGYLIHSGNQAAALAPNIVALPFVDL